MKKQDSAVRENAKAEQTKINRLYHDLLGMDAGLKIIEDLEKFFDKRSMVVRSEGRVDVNGTLVRNGHFEVMSFIKQRIKLGEQNK